METIWENQIGDALSAEFSVEAGSRLVVDIGEDNGTPPSNGNNLGGGTIWLLRSYSQGGPYGVAKETTKVGALEVLTGTKKAYFKVRLHGSSGSNLTAKYTVENRRA